MKATQSAVIAVAASLALLLQGCFEDPAAKSISAPPSTMKVLKKEYEEEKDLIEWEYEKAKENAKHMEGKQEYEEDKTALKESMKDDLKPYEGEVAAAEEKHEDRVEKAGHELMDEKAAASAKAEKKVEEAAEKATAEAHEQMEKTKKAVKEAEEAAVKQAQEAEAQARDAAEAEHEEAVDKADNKLDKAVDAAQDDPAFKEYDNEKDKLKEEHKEGLEEYEKTKEKADEQFPAEAKEEPAPAEEAVTEATPGPPEEKPP